MRAAPKARVVSSFKPESCLHALKSSVTCTAPPLLFVTNPHLRNIASIGAFGFGMTQLMLLYNAIKCIRGGPRASAQVWEGAKGLEWTVPSPAPHHTFAVPPVVE